MAGRGAQTFKKRQKEQQRKEKQQEKLAKRLERKRNPQVESPDGEFESIEPSEDLERPEESGDVQPSL